MKKGTKKEKTVQTKEDMIKQVVALKRDLEKIEMERASGKLHDVSLVGKKKKEIARLFTFIRQKEISAV